MSTIGREKLWYIRAVEYYSETKKNKPQITSNMNKCKSIMLN